MKIVSLVCRIITLSWERYRPALPTASDEDFSASRLRAGPSCGSAVVTGCSARPESLVRSITASRLLLVFASTSLSTLIALRPYTRISIPSGRALAVPPAHDALAMCRLPRSPVGHSCAHASHLLSQLSSSSIWLIHDLS